jgi:hypothetical protein
MNAMSQVVDFLLSMMRDDKTKAAFARDPDGTFAEHGLSGVTGQDVQDAHLSMCDGGSVHAKPGHGGGGGGGGHHDDPVRAVQHVTNNYEVTEIDESSHTSIGEINVLEIDDRDTTVIDSFNSDDDTSVVAVQDNDTTNNTTNTDVDVTNVEDSFNEGDTNTIDQSEQNDVGDVGVITDPAPEPEAIDATEAVEAVEDPVPDPVFDETQADHPADVTIDDPGADLTDDAAFDPAVAG